MADSKDPYNLHPLFTPTWLLLDLSLFVLLLHNLLLLVDLILPVVLEDMLQLLPVFDLASEVFKLLKGANFFDFLDLLLFVTIVCFVKDDGLDILEFHRLQSSRHPSQRRCVLELVLLWLDDFFLNLLYGRRTHKSAGPTRLNREFLVLTEQVDFGSIFRISDRHFAKRSHPVFVSGSELIGRLLIAIELAGVGK